MYTLNGEDREQFNTFILPHRGQLGIVSVLFFLSIALISAFIVIFFIILKRYLNSISDTNHSISVAKEDLEIFISEDFNSTYATTINRILTDIQKGKIYQESVLDLACNFTANIIEKYFLTNSNYSKSIKLSGNRFNTGKNMISCDLKQKNQRSGLEGEKKSDTTTSEYMFAFGAMKNFETLINLIKNQLHDNLFINPLENIDNDAYFERTDEVAKRAFKYTKTMASIIYLLGVYTNPLTSLIPDNALSNNPDRIENCMDTVTRIIKVLIECIKTFEKELNLSPYQFSKEDINDLNQSTRIKNTTSVRLVKEMLSAIKIIDKKITLNINLMIIKAMKLDPIVKWNLFFRHIEDNFEKAEADLEQFDISNINKTIDKEEISKKIHNFEKAINSLKGDHKDIADKYIIKKVEGIKQQRHFREDSVFNISQINNKSYADFENILSFFNRINNDDILNIKEEWLQNLTAAILLKAMKDQCLLKVIEPITLLCTILNNCNLEELANSSHIILEKIIICSKIKNNNNENFVKDFLADLLKKSRKNFSNYRKSIVCSLTVNLFDRYSFKDNLISKIYKKIEDMLSDIYFTNSMNQEKVPILSIFYLQNSSPLYSTSRLVEFPHHSNNVDQIKRTITDHFKAIEQASQIDIFNNLSLSTEITTITIPSMLNLDKIPLPNLLMFSSQRKCYDTIMKLLGKNTNGTYYPEVIKHYWRLAKTISDSELYLGDAFSSINQDLKKCSFFYNISESLKSNSNEENELSNLLVRLLLSKRSLESLLLKKNSSFIYQQKRYDTPLSTFCYLKELENKSTN